MIFYKIPLNADLSNTSYRVFVLLDDCAFIEFNEGNIENDWIEYTEEQIVDEYGYNVMEQIPSVETVQESTRTIINSENYLSIIKEVVEKLLISKPDAKKDGFDLQLVFTNKGAFVWEHIQKEIKDKDDELGCYLHPIKYEIGMTVEFGNWYYLDEENYGKDIPYECIKSGLPTGFTDKEFFDVIPV